MRKRNADGPTAATLRARQRIALALLAAIALYFGVQAVKLIRLSYDQGSVASSFSQAPLCGARTSASCIRLVPVTVGAVTNIYGGQYFHLIRGNGENMLFHDPSQPNLHAELRKHLPVSLEVFRGSVIAIRDREGHREFAFPPITTVAQNTAVGASGLLFFTLVVLAVAIAVWRFPVDMAVGGGPGRYALPLTIRPPQRWLYAVFALPSVAWLLPAVLDAHARANLDAVRIAGDLAGGVLFGAVTAGALLFFAAWYLENRIEMTDDHLVYRTLFTRRSIRYDEIAGWLTRHRRRSRKVQYIDLYRRGEKMPVRLQMDMHWRRSKEIVLDVLSRKAPQVDDQEVGAVGR